VLPQHPDDLLFREPCSLHLSVLQEGRTLNSPGGKSQWQVTRHKISADLYAPFGSCFWKVPRMALLLNTIGRFRPSDSLAMKEPTSLLGNWTKIWKCPAESHELVRLRRREADTGRSAFARTLSVPALSRRERNQTNCDT